MQSPVFRGFLCSSVLVGLFLAPPARAGSPLAWLKAARVRYLQKRYSPRAIQIAQGARLTKPHFLNIVGGAPYDRSIHNQVMKDASKIPVKSLRWLMRKQITTPAHAKLATDYARARAPSLSAQDVVKVAKGAQITSTRNQIILDLARSQYNRWTAKDLHVLRKGAQYTKVQWSIDSLIREKLLASPIRDTAH